MFVFCFFLLFPYFSRCFKNNFINKYIIYSDYLFEYILKKYFNFFVWGFHHQQKKCLDSNEAKDNSLYSTTMTEFEVDDSMNCSADSSGLVEEDSGNMDSLPVDDLDGPDSLHSDKQLVNEFGFVEAEELDLTKDDVEFGDSIVDENGKQDELEIDKICQSELVSWNYSICFN